jgi:hypothetical protein
VATTLLSIPLVRLSYSLVLKSHRICLQLTQAPYIAFFIMSSRGVLVCGGFSRGVASASLDDTCCNLTLNKDNRDDPQLSAVCQTNRFRQSGCHNLDDTGEWRTTNISLNSCQARRPGSTSDVMMGHVDGCTKTLLNVTPVVLSTNCGAQKTNLSLCMCLFPLVHVWVSLTLNSGFY